MVSLLRDSVCLNKAECKAMPVTGQATKNAYRLIGHLSQMEHKRTHGIRTGDFAEIASPVLQR